MKLASCRWRYKRRKPNSTRISTFNKKLTNNSGMLWRFPQRCKPGTASTSFCSSTSSRRVAVLTAEGAAQLDLPRSWAALHAIYLAPACCPQRRGAAVAPSTTRPFARAGIMMVGLRLFVGQEKRAGGRRLKPAPRGGGAFGRRLRPVVFAGACRSAVGILACCVSLVVEYYLRMKPTVPP